MNKQLRLDIRCSHCQTKITANLPQPGNINVRCPKCKNILKIKACEDGTVGEIVKEY